MVEFVRVFLDPLHLLIRVGDLLLEKLINEVLDAQVGRCLKCQKGSCASCPCDCHTATLAHLVTLAKEAHCHLDFWVKETEAHGNEEKAKKLKWGTPYGRELHNLLRSLDLHALLPSRAPEIKAVWQGFLDFHALLGQRPPLHRRGDHGVQGQSEELGSAADSGVPWQPL